MSGSQADFWQGPTGTLPVVNANGNIFEEVQVAAGGQTVFTLATFTYTLGTKSIWVFRKTAADAGVGGEMLRRVVDYAETASNKITLLTPAVAGDTITFIAFGVNQLIAPVVNNGIPQGGATGAVLQKSSGSDFDAAWVPQSSVTTLLDSARQNVASASTVSLVAIANQTRNINITGGIQIDGFQITNGQVWAVKFAGALTLKNNANTVTETGADIITTPNATCFLRAIADNTVEVLSYSAPNGPLLASSLNTGPFGRKNHFINGGMLNNQRGTVNYSSSVSQYTLDQWLLSIAGTTVSANVASSALGNAKSGFGLWITSLTTTGVGTINFAQRLESKITKKFSGAIITISGNIRSTLAAAAVMNIAVNKANATDNFGAETNVGVSSNINVANATAITTFSATFTLGATDGDNGLEIQFTLSNLAAQTGATFTLFDLQLEFGSIATPFELIPPAVTDLECKRYLYVTNYGTPKGGTVGAFAAFAASNAFVCCHMRYPVQMRAIPTIQIWNAVVQNQIRNTNTGVVLANTVNSYVSNNVNGFGNIIFNSATLTANNAYDFDLIISAEL